MVQGDDRPRARLPIGGRQAVGGLLLLLGGLLCLVLLAASFLPNAALWFFGRRVTAEVVDHQAEPIGDAEDGVLEFRYSIRYEFTAANGEVFAKTVPVGMEEWGSLGEGGRVAVTYFPLYPAHNQLDMSRYALLISCGYVPLFLASGAAVVAGWRLVRPLFTRQGGG